MLNVGDVLCVAEIRVCGRVLPGLDASAEQRHFQREIAGVFGSSDEIVVASESFAERATPIVHRGFLGSFEGGLSVSGCLSLIWGRWRAR